MIGVLRKYPYLISRRIIQFSLLALFAGANYFGWNLLTGNYSSAQVLGVIPLSDPYAVMQTFAGGIIVGADAFIGAVIILGAYVILGGRTFCSWVCPVNILADVTAWIRKKLKLGSQKVIEIPKNLRYGILAVSLILSFILGFAAFEMVSPIGVLHRGLIFGIGAGWTIILALVIFDFAFIKYGWCAHLCPLGAFYAILGKVGWLKVMHNKNHCTDCGDCFPVCPEEQVLSKIGKESYRIASGECLNCGRCIEACNDNALAFSLRIKPK